MNYILFDGAVRNQLLPFTFTRPVADIRIGILTLREKWELLLNASTSTKTEAYLSGKFPEHRTGANIYINASFAPGKDLVKFVKNLSENQALFAGDIPVAYFSSKNHKVDFSSFEIISCSHTDFFQVENTWDIFSKNGEALRRDFEILTENRKSQPIPEEVRVRNPENIFIEKGARLGFCILDASEGPVYIGKNSEIMDGSVIKGPFSLGEHAIVKMGAKIYSNTTIGPHSRVGGEVNNSVIFGYSNKGHDGFLGNSVLGEWCNLGADTNNSNLKNNYSEVRLWNYETESFAKTGLQFCGLMMGDHSKCGINTMFNTGTVVGVSANIFGSGFPRNFIPSFSWGGSGGFTTYQTRKVFEVAEVVMARRNVEFSEEDRKILEHIFKETARWRRS